MLLRLAKMVTHLDTDVLASMLQLSLAVLIFGKLLTAATDSPAAQSSAADGSCMQAHPQTAIKSTCHNKWAKSVHTCNRHPV